MLFFCVSFTFGRLFMLFSAIRICFLVLCFNLWIFLLNNLDTTLIIVVAKIFGFGYKSLFNKRRFIMKIDLSGLGAKFSLFNEHHDGDSRVAYVWLLCDVKVILSPLHRIFAKILPHFELELILVTKNSFSLLLLVLPLALILQFLFFLALSLLLKHFIFFYLWNTGFKNDVHTKQT